MTKSLDVFISGEHVGKVAQDANGFLSFEYDTLYSGIPLSLSMPTSERVHPQRSVYPFLMGLLPDDAGVRAEIGTEYSCSGNNPFALLSHIGMDCPGAVQICKPEDAYLIARREEELQELDEHDMAGIVMRVRQYSSAAWGTKSGRWSLGGAQSKIALRCVGGTWYKCLGGAATTHIVKPGVVGYDFQALDEHLCMKLAREIGLPVAKTEYLHFEDECAISVQRYDRVVQPAGAVTRLHQEDLCQALAISSEKKYAEQGGPSTLDVFKLLGVTGSQAAFNSELFLYYLVFNYLIGATDAHAKNYSLLHGLSGYTRLAPLYDVASIAPYASLVPRQRKPLRAAMSIGGENRFGMLTQDNVRKMVETCALENIGIGAETVGSVICDMAGIIPDALSDVLANAKDEEIEGIDFLANPLLEEIAGNCRRTQASLAK